MSQSLRITLQHSDPEAALVHARTAVDVSDRVGGEHAQAMARRFLALSLLYVDRVDEAAEVLAQVDQAASSPTSASRRGNLLANAAAVALRRGDRLQAEERLDEAVALGIEIGQPCWEAELLLADVAHTDGRHADAEMRLVAGLKGVAAEDLATRGRLLWRTGREHRLLGNLDGARAELVEALRLLSDQEIQHLPDLLAAEQEQALLEGKPTEDRVAQMRGRLADGALPWGLLPV